MKLIFTIGIILCSLFAIDLVAYRILDTHPFSIKYFQTMLSESTVVPKKLLCNFQGKDYVRHFSGLGSVYEECVIRVSDGGDSCFSGSLCQSGKCYIEKEAISDSLGRYTGRCGKAGEKNRCQFAEIENGKIVLDIRGAICD